MLFHPFRPKPRAGLALSLFITSSFLLYHSCSREGSAPSGKGDTKKKGGDVPVSLIKVAVKSVPVEISVIGSVEPYSAITVKAQVGGELTKVHFTEGDYVKKGDLLFNIDPRPLDAALRQSEANLAKDRAVLGQMEANLARDQAQEKFVQDQADRFHKLFEQGIISKDQAEQYRTSASVAGSAVAADKAAIESARASVVAARAAIENVRVQLGYTTIRSPIDGRTGNILVKGGNLVNAGQTDLTVINQVNPIYVTFAVPESRLSEIKKYMANAKLPVFAKPQEDEAEEEQGVLTFVDNNVDTSTGTIRLKGTFVNSHRRLWPGQFVRVRLRLTTLNEALVVPNQAVQTGQDGSYVYVVKEDRRVEARPVTTGGRVDQELVVEKGLQAGETVVTDGHLRLAPGMRVAERSGKGGGKKGKKAPESGEPKAEMKGEGKGKGEAKEAKKE